MHEGFLNTYISNFFFYHFRISIGTPVERFVSLDDVSSDKSAVALASGIVALLEKFNVPAAKLVAQTYDGARVMSGASGGTQAIVKKSFPNADYIHCKAHVLNLVLLHALTNETQKDFFRHSLQLLRFSRKVRREMLN